MYRSEPPSSFFPALVLALGLAMGGWLIGSGIRQVALAKESVTVKGYSDQEITSDFGLWSATVTVRGLKLADTGKTLQNQMAAVTKFLESQGVPATRIAVQQVNSYPLMRTTDSGNTTSIIDSFVTSQRVSVESTDIAMLQALTLRSPELLGLGYEINLEPTQYFRRELGDLKIKLLGNAIEDAQTRAREMASRTGRSIGRLRSTTQGVFQVTAASSTEISPTGELDTSSVEKKIRAVVTAEFELK
ncbi:MAG: SIMPL domain-containing protein [Candidatus Methylacidiphilales bacterium]|nr:SIMPL domain-containing protein [Candidatus Methylacidiphilales bacterium]